jgi:hypothetical protein
MAAVILITAGLYFARHELPEVYVNPIVLGRVEYTVLEDEKMKMKSRIDTGAGMSSLDAKIINLDEANSKVTFETKDEFGNKKSFTKPILGWIDIKAKGRKGTIKRPVIEMEICLGGKVIEARVNLADRSKFLYPMLIGRNILKSGDYLVNSKRKFMEHPGCKYNR